MIVVVGQGVYRGCVKMHQETTCARIPSALIEFFRNLLAVLLAATFVFVLLVCKLMLPLLCSNLIILFLNSIPTNLTYVLALPSYCKTDMFSLERE